MTTRRTRPRLEPPPPAPKRPVVDVHHGVSVRDDYRWLEDGASDEVRTWSRAQDERARGWLERRPGARVIRRRMGELLRAKAPRWVLLRNRGAVTFALKDDPPRQQPFLVTLDSPDDPTGERVIFDPVELDPSGRTAIDFAEPSLDGRLVAVSLSAGGDESGTLFVLDAETGEMLPDSVRRVNSGNAGGSVAWNADGTGLWYTHHPAPGELPPEDAPFYQQVFFHRLGTSSDQDRLELGPELGDPRIAQSTLTTSEDGRFTVARVARGDGGDYEFFVYAEPTGWRRVAGFDAGWTRSRFGPDGHLWVLARADAPRGRVLRVDPLEPARAVVVVPEGQRAIASIEVTTDRLWIHELDGGPSRLVARDHRGRDLGDVPLPPVACVGQLHALGDALLYECESMVEPPRWHRVDATLRAAPTALGSAPVADFSDCEVVRDEAISDDGTPIPLTILKPRGLALDGSHPTILYGYGGYGVSMEPTYRPSRSVWLERGGIWVVAHVRGGAEHGEEWHRAGMLARKQNVFDDFAAAARHLVARRYTRPEKLGIAGGSNGGLLIGAVIAQHPALARAAVAEVGIFDMIRVELHPNGVHNVTEFGTVTDPTLYWALRGYSPYHQVRDGTAYPSVMLTAGEKDPRVDAYHARKMAARLQAATASDAPILLRVRGGGHGVGAPLDEQIAERAEMFVFFASELGAEEATAPRASSRRSAPSSRA